MGKRRNKYEASLDTYKNRKYPDDAYLNSMGILEQIKDAYKYNDKHTLLRFCHASWDYSGNVDIGTLLSCKLRDVDKEKIEECKRLTIANRSHMFFVTTGAYIVANDIVRELWTNPDPELKAIRDYLVL